MKGPYKSKCPCCGWGHPQTFDRCGGTIIIWLENGQVWCKRCNRLLGYFQER